MILAKEQLAVHCDEKTTLDAKVSGLQAAMEEQKQKERLLCVQLNDWKITAGERARQFLEHRASSKQGQQQLSRKLERLAGDAKIAQKVLSARVREHQARAQQHEDAYEIEVVRSTQEKSVLTRRIEGLAADGAAARHDLEAQLAANQAKTAQTEQVHVGELARRTLAAAKLDAQIETLAQQKTQMEADHALTKQTHVEHTAEHLLNAQEAAEVHRSEVEQLQAQHMAVAAQVVEHRRQETEAKQRHISVAQQLEAVQIEQQNTSKMLAEAMGTITGLKQSLHSSYTVQHDAVNAKREVIVAGNRVRYSMSEKITKANAEHEQTAQLLQKGQALSTELQGRLDTVMAGLEARTSELETVRQQLQALVSSTVEVEEEAATELARVESAERTALDEKEWVTQQWTAAQAARTRQEAQLASQVQAAVALRQQREELAARVVERDGMIVRLSAQGAELQEALETSQQQAANAQQMAVQLNRQLKIIPGVAGKAGAMPLEENVVSHTSVSADGAATTKITVHNVGVKAAAMAAAAGRRGRGRGAVAAIARARQ
jgi:hypothetical protein